MNPALDQNGKYLGDASLVDGGTDLPQSKNSKEYVGDIVYTAST